MKIIKNLLIINDVSIEVTQKKIKNIRLSVHPPDGSVKISAPLKIDMNTIHNFTVSKLDWIKKQQKKFEGKTHYLPLNYISDENHLYLGKFYTLKIIHHNKKHNVILNQNSIELYIKPGTDKLKRKSILEKWYREKLNELIPALILKWESIMDLRVNNFGIKKMKTRWGTCNIREKKIWINLELSKKSIQCLEYIIVHEMVHLLEKNHNKRFKSFMNQFLPDWKSLKTELNSIK